jgi:hypothetical protein
MNPASPNPTTSIGASLTSPLAGTQADNQLTACARQWPLPSGPSGAHRRPAHGLRPASSREAALPLSIGTDGEPSARFPREADFRRGGSLESGRRTGTARIRAARRRTASAASSGARCVKLGSASSISWSTSSRGACHSRSRPSVSASGPNLVDIVSGRTPHFLHAGGSRSRRCRRCHPAVPVEFPWSPEDAAELSPRSPAWFRSDSGSVAQETREGGTRRGLERGPSGRCHSLCPASPAPDRAIADELGVAERMSFVEASAESLSPLAARQPRRRYRGGLPTSLLEQSWRLSYVCVGAAQSGRLSTSRSRSYSSTSISPLARRSASLRSGPVLPS